MIRKLNCQALALGTTALALVASPLFAQPVEEVVVTGSHIRGVAPVGSTPISVGQEDLAKTGASAASDFLLKIPQVLSLGTNEQNQAGGTRMQGTAGNGTFTRSLNLRGLGIELTLTLFNGQRFTRTQTSDVSDIDMFPVSLMQRIEVVADGASATYGSDAVAGIANVILREPYDVVQTQFQVGLKDGSMDWQALFTLGTTWDAAGSGIGDGGITLAYFHSYIDPVDAKDRPTLYNDDLTPYLGAVGAQPTFTPIGNVRGLLGPAGTTAVFAAPNGTLSTQGITLASLGAANNPRRMSIWEKAFPLPRISKDTFSGVFKQELTDWLTFSAFGVYMRRSGGGTYGTGPQPNATITVPSTNPYSPCTTVAGAAGLNRTNTAGLTCPANNLLTVLYAFTNEYGTSTHRDFSQNQYDMQAAFDIDLPFDFHAKVTGYYGKDAGAGTVNPAINTTALTHAVSGGTAVNATTGVVTGTKPANVPFFNPFCDNTAGPCNDPITNAYIRSTSTNSNSNWLNDYKIVIDGPLFDLPGGTVKVAAGAYWAKQGIHILNYNYNSAAIGARVITSDANSRETVKAFFGEVYIPIVGDANAMPGISKLELTLAHRRTDYEISGVTNDPKIGVNWSPIPEVKIHGSWGTSFKAPNLRVNDVTAGAAFFVVNTITCGQYAGIVCPTPATALTLYSNTGGSPGVTPETAKTWSLGADWTPDGIPGLFVSLNYFNIKVDNQISQATRDAGDVGVVNSGNFDDYVRFNPTYFPTRALNNKPYVVNGVAVNSVTQAEYNNFITVLRTDSNYINMTTAAANPVAFFYDGRFSNFGVLEMDGIDFNGRYDFDTEFGAAHLGLSGSYTLNLASSPVTGTPLIDRTNQFGHNQSLRSRFEAGLDFIDSVSLTGYVNYVGSYDVDPSFLPPTAGAQYLTVDSYTTFDLSFGYNTGDEISVPLLRNMQLAAVITNVFDTLPPFMLNGGSATPALFDPNSGSAVGRFITLRVTKDW